MKLHSVGSSPSWAAIHWRDQDDGAGETGYAGFMPDYLQLQRARTLLNMSAQEVAAAVDEPRSAVMLLESGHVQNGSLATKLQALYESMGVEFGERGMVGIRPEFVKGSDSSIRH